MIKIVVVTDVFSTNSYFYIDEKTHSGFLIDPGAEGERLVSIIQKNSWNIEKILLTHGHFDHMGGISEIKKFINIPIMSYKNSDMYLLNPKMNLSIYCHRNITVKNSEHFVDGDRLFLNSNKDFFLDVIYTPGHTKDSCVFYNKNDGIAFVGDTIFKGSIGNTGYPGGDLLEIKDSILNKIFKLPKNTILYSGHSPQTTINDEFNNVYLY